MYPELFHIPLLGIPVKSYGFMLMVGFLSAIWLAMRRAERVKGDPDLILNMGFIALIGGVAGARIFYVAHYWDSQFAYLKNPLWASINITAGGLEYYGGLLCGIAGVSIYLLIKRVSWRMYMDILAPTAMWGLAFGRMGCLLNGCCWGGLCVDAHNHAALPWAMRFPFGSPAFQRQWENRQVTVPAELIFVSPVLPADNYPLPRDLLSMSPEERLGPQRKMEELQEELKAAKASDPDSKAVRELEARIAGMRDKYSEHSHKVRPLAEALKFPSREDPSRRMTVSELEDLADRFQSLPVHPSQIYGIINAFLLSGLLSLLFTRRKRHGVVLAVMMILYPITRLILEAIRVDNPRDSFGLTISQAISVGMFCTGVVFLIVLYKFLPIRSPRAVPFVPPAERDSTPNAERARA